MEVLKPCPTSARCQSHPWLEPRKELLTFCSYSLRREGVYTVRRIYCVLPFARAEDVPR